MGTSQADRRAAVLRGTLVTGTLSCAVGGIPEADDCVRLGTFLALDDVKLHIVALFERFVSIQLNCRVVDEYIRPVFASDESVALGVVKPLNLTFELSHWLPPSLVVGEIW